MSARDDCTRNDATYQRVKDVIDRTFPKGRFVGIADDKIVGDAATFRELERALWERACDPRNVLVVEAGIAYPEYLTIFI